MKDMTQRERIKLAYALADATWKTAKEYKADAGVVEAVLAILVVTLAARSDASLDEVLADVQAMAQKMSEKTGTAGTGGSTEGA